MKRTTFLLIAVMTVTSSSVWAQLFQARSVTSAYAWQRHDAVGQTDNHLYGFQTFQASLADQRYSVNANLRWFNDFAGPLKNDPSVRLSTLSFKARNLFDMVDVQAGRFFVYAGAGVGLMDGGLVTAKLPWYPVKVTGYYGALTPARQKLGLIDNAADNAMAGFHAVVQPMQEAQFSLSYAYRSMEQETYLGIRADSLFNPVAVSLRPSPRTEQILSADGSFDVAGYGEMYLRYDHDLHTEAMARLNIFGRAFIMEGLALTGEYLQREPRVAFNSIFSVFAYSTLKEVEGGVEYEVLKDWFLVGKFGSISYGDGTTTRVTVAANGRLIGASISKNTTYNGDISAASLNAAYPLLDNFVTPTLLVGFSQYKLDESAPLENALSVAGGAVVRPLPTLSIDGQVQWINNRLYANDVRLSFRLSYLFTQRLNLF